MKTRWLLIAVNVCWMAFAAVAADWPQWRGPERNGLSKETGLLQEWPKEGPKLLWHVKDIGDGYSTPSVVGDWLYVLSNTGKDNEFVQSRQVKDGKVGWTTKLGKVGPNMGPQYPGSRSTPTVDGDRVYALGSDGDLVCVKLADGAEVWRKNLRTDFAGKPGQWAYSESVLIDGDVLACTPGGAEATLLALDKKNGACHLESGALRRGQSRLCLDHHRERGRHQAVRPIPRERCRWRGCQDRQATVAL